MNPHRNLWQLYPAPRVTHPCYLQGLLGKALFSMHGFHQPALLSLSWIRAQIRCPSLDLCSSEAMPMCQEPALSFTPSHGELGWGGQVTWSPFGHQPPLQGLYLHPLGAAVPQDKGLDGSRSCPKPVMGSGAC